MGIRKKDTEQRGADGDPSEAGGQGQERREVQGGGWALTLPRMLTPPGPAGSGPTEVTWSCTVNR